MDTEDSHPVGTDCFEDPEYSNPTELTALTRELDDLHQQVLAGEGQPMETLNHIECKLQKLSIMLHPPAATEPLGEVI